MSHSPLAIACNNTIDRFRHNIQGLGTKLVACTYAFLSTVTLAFTDSKQKSLEMQNQIFLDMKHIMLNQLEEITPQKQICSLSGSSALDICRRHDMVQSRMIESHMQ